MISLCGESSFEERYVFIVIFGDQKNRAFKILALFGRPDFGNVVQKLRSRRPCICVLYMRHSEIAVDIIKDLHDGFFRKDRHEISGGSVNEEC